MTAPAYRPFPQIRRVLVAVDASKASREVLDYAVAIARVQGARLLCIHAVGGVTSPLGFELEPPDPGAREAAEQRIRALCGDVDDVELEVELVEGRVPDVILEVVARRDIDMLIMGTHGRTGLSHEMNRSVAETLVRLAPCPVVSIPVS